MRVSSRSPDSKFVEFVSRTLCQLKFPALFVVALLLLVPAQLSAQTHGGRYGDSLALVAIRDANPGSSIPLTGKYGWYDGNPLDSWAGVHLTEGTGAGWEYTSGYRAPPFLRVDPDTRKKARVDRLSLVSKKLTTMPEEIGTLSELVELDLSYNLLKALPPEVFNLSKLTELILHHNQLATLPANIGRLAALEILCIASNQFVELPREICNNASIQILTLDSNFLSGLPLEMRKLTKLKVLWVSANRLTTLPKEIGELSSLTDLDMHKNQMKSIPKEIGNCSNLFSLNLSCNNLTALPAEIGNLENLNDLFLRNNQLLGLPASMSKLNLYGVLDVDSNHLFEWNLPRAVMSLLDKKWARVDRGTQTDTILFSRVVPQMTLPGTPITLTTVMSDARTNSGTCVWLIADKGSNYTVSHDSTKYYSPLGLGTTILPASHFVGKLTIPVRAVTGLDTSAVRLMHLTVRGTNRAPRLTVAKSRHIGTSPFLVLPSMTDASDPDGDTLCVQISGGDHYTVKGAYVKPDREFYGDISVPIRVSDGNLRSKEVRMLLTVDDTVTAGP